MQRKRHKLTFIKWFHQSKNKEARIYSNSATVQNTVLMPQDWANRWKDFHKAIMTYQKKVKIYMMMFVTL